MRSMSYPKLILFDLDGVILDTEVMYMNLMLKYNKKNNLKMSKEFYINNLLGKTKNTISPILKELWKDKYDEVTYWKGLLEYRSEYIKSNKIKVKHGFNDLYKCLKDSGCYVGLVTSNSIELIRKLFSKSNLSETMFDIIITREDVKSTKPNSEPYELAVAKMNIDKEYVVAIEDSSIGIEAAINAGISVFNVKDISIVDNKLKSKCLLADVTLNKISKLFKI